ncbi:MAG: hypothetical protein HOP15_00630 [Planctomycetes bacterium]|nr:hypothetical protein [Planctomycetota bacterium]
MKRLLTALAFTMGAATASAQVGQKANLDVVQWLNTPPITAEQLQGHAVVVEVFRTW